MTSYHHKNLEAHFHLLQINLHSTQDKLQITPQLSSIRQAIMIHCLIVIKKNMPVSLKNKDMEQHIHLKENINFRKKLISSRKSMIQLEKNNMNGKKHQKHQLF